LAVGAEKRNVDHEDEGELGIAVLSPPIRSEFEREEEDDDKNAGGNPRQISTDEQR
jgi:hypothetical protein